jgi:hypothetical protein
MLGNRNGLLVLSATVVALGLAIGLPQASVQAGEAEQVSAKRVATAFDVLPMGDRVGVESAQSLTTAVGAACNGRALPQLGRVCAAHILIKVGQERKARFITVERHEGEATTILERIPVAH